MNLVKEVEFYDCHLLCFVDLRLDFKILVYNSCMLIICGTDYMHMQEPMSIREK